MLGKILRERYKIIRELGGGGFGQTYLAQDMDIPYNPNCVVKQLRRQHTNNPEVVIRFENEAQVLYKLGNHERIPRLLAHFQDNQEFYLVQEFIDGHDLRKEIAPALVQEFIDGNDLRKEITPAQKWSEKQVIEFLRDVLEILDFVHQQGIIHRDIKPANIVRRSGDGRLVLIDFGAVKEISNLAANIPGETVTIGTYGYMPSEQTHGNPKFCSDIYAVGIVCIQALTGIDPTAKGGHGLPKDELNEEIIWRDNVQVTPKLADILDKMVRYDFRQRYQSATEILQDIDQAPSRLHKIYLAIGSIAVIFSITILTIPQILNPFKPANINVAYYENSTFHIKMKYPQTWKKEEINDTFTGDLAKFTALNSSNNGNNGNKNFAPVLTVNFKDLQQPISLVQYTTGKIDEITQFLTNPKIEQSHPITLANLPPAHEVVYSGKEGKEGKEGEYTVKRRAVWLLKNNRAYIITYTAEESQYDEFFNVAQEMINSLEIR
ncbi:MAG: protein kinase [Gloeotrichia echinulata GP01]